MTHAHGKPSIYWVRNACEHACIKGKAQMPCERGPKATLMSNKVNKPGTRAPPKRRYAIPLPLSLAHGTKENAKCVCVCVVFVQWFKS